MLSLLRWAEDRRIPPRLSELAAWLASLSLPVFDALAITEPALLLRSDLTALDGARKEKLVGGLLAAVQEEEPTVWRWESRRNFARLAYAGLAEQLCSWIADRGSPVEVRATALQIALACKVKQLAELAVDLALSVGEPTRIRHASARLVANHGDREQLARLRLLAVGPATTDDLQSILLTRLWPDHVSTEELFAASHVAPSWQCLGGYRYAPDELLHRFKAGDVVIGLNWLRETVPSHVDLDSNRLAYAIAARAWELLDDPGVMHVFSHVVWRCLKRYVGIFKRGHERTDAPHPFTTDSEKRRRLLLAILPMADQLENELVELALTKDRLLFDEDLPWLVDQYEHVDDDRQKTRLTHWLVALQVTDLGEMYGWFEENFPAAGDPPHPSGQPYAPTPRDDLADLREACIRRLVAFGTVQAIEAIERLAERFPGQPGWRERLHAARAARREKEWRPLCPRKLIAFVQQTDKRFVRDAAELSEAVIASLERLQHLLQGDTPLAPFLWNVGKDGCSGRPKSEDRFSDFVLHHLRRDLPGAVIDREVQVRNAKESGIGERTDLKVEARTEDGSSIVVIIESKGCWNKDLCTAMCPQLKERYLQRHAWRQGIYLVGYFGCDFWSSDDDRKQASRNKGANREALQASLAGQAADLSDSSCRITARVLDIRHPRSTN